MRSASWGLHGTCSSALPTPFSLTLYLCLSITDVLFFSHTHNHVYAYIYTLNFSPFPFLFYLPAPSPPSLPPLPTPPSRPGYRRDVERLQKESARAAVKAGELAARLLRAQLEAGKPLSKEVAYASLPPLAISYSTTIMSLNFYYDITNLWCQ